MRNWIPSIVILCATILQAQDSALNQILRPIDGASMHQGKVEGIAKVTKTGKILLDGSPLPTLEKAPGVLTFNFNPPAGKHTLELVFDGGSQKIVFHSSNNSEKPFRVHPPAATCEICHAVKAGAWSLKTDTLEATCASCHNLSQFARTHTHNSTQLAECAMCHNPHGSTEVFHLKYPSKVACKQCHG